VDVSGAMVTAASEQVLENAVAVGVNHQTQAFTGKFQHRGIFFADSSYCTYVYEKYLLEIKYTCADQER
jgi:hypothetical protein